MKLAYLIVAAGLVASCTQRDAEAAQNFDAVGETETFRFAGNEPFWGGEVTGTSPLLRRGRILSSHHLQ